MSRLTWHNPGERFYETGVDRGVLFLLGEDGAYEEAHAWAGLVSVTEAPSGAEATPQYADNIKYLNLVSAEEFGATIEAFAYPTAFGRCDGSAEVAPGVFVGQQRRETFGFSYRTLVGNDLEGQDHAYKLHLVYGALAAPSEKARNTVNDTPEAMTFSWELTTTPVEVPGLRPTAILTVDSRDVSTEDLKDLEDLLYGTETGEASLPMPEDVIAMFAAAG